MKRVDKKQPVDIELGPLRAIGDALQRNYRAVSEEKIPDNLLNLLDQLQKMESGVTPDLRNDSNAQSAGVSKRNSSDAV